MKMTYRFAFVFLFLANFTFAFQVILKNGKTVEGTFVTEDSEKISIKDKDGVPLNFKKSLIDLEKTAEANKPVAETPKAEKVEPQKDSTAAPPAKPKKPARVYTANDLYRLRGSIPLDNSGADIQQPSPDAGPSKGMTGEQWQQLTQSLLDQVHAAEQYSQEASAKCKELQGATIQTHIVVNDQNQTVNMADATKQACQAAEDAKGQIDSAKQAYQDAVEQAKQQNVLPGYITQE
jgi:hypothetical protein